MSGFDMKKISIVGRDYHSEEHVLGYFNAGDRMKFFGKLGVSWGGLAGVLFGSAMMFVPVIGHVIVLGPLAATLFGGVEGAVLGGGASALVGALTAIGVPEDSVLRYETAVKADKFLLSSTRTKRRSNAHVGCLAPSSTHSTLTSLPETVLDRTLLVTSADSGVHRAGRRRR